MGGLFGGGGGGGGGGYQPQPIVQAQPTKVAPGTLVQTVLKGPGTRPADNVLVGAAETDEERQRRLRLQILNNNIILGGSNFTPLGSSDSSGGAVAPGVASTGAEGSSADGTVG